MEQSLNNGESELVDKCSSLSPFEGTILRQILQGSCGGSGNVLEEVQVQGASLTEGPSYYALKPISVFTLRSCFPLAAPI